jgi:hypothetical protein
VIHIPIVGGLGNQLFIVAFAAYNEIILGNEVQLYLDRPRRSNQMHGQNAAVDIIWPEKFDIIDAIKTLSFRYRLGEILRGIKSPSMSKMLVPGELLREKDCMEMTINNTFQPHESYYCRGYFQKAKFQSELASRGMFTNLSPRVKTQWYTETIDNFAENSFTALHVRLGDYLKPNVDRALGLSYYERSLQICKNKKVLIFSDEPKKAFKLFQHIHSNKELVFLDPPSQSKAIESLNLLSKADEIICSDSTFSWWGAALGRKKKLVVAPTGTWVHRELGLAKSIKDCLIAT